MSVPRGATQLDGGPDDLRRVFIALLDVGNFNAAARALGVSAGTVRSRLDRLEDLVGEPVFFRLRSGFALTPAGATLAETLGSDPAPQAFLDRAGAKWTAPAPRDTPGADGGGSRVGAGDRD